MLVKILATLVILIIPKPRLGIYELIEGNDQPPLRKPRKGEVEVLAIENGWVRYALLPRVSFSVRSMRVAAFMLSYKFKGEATA